MKKQKYLFDADKRYTTAGIHSTVPFMIQLQLWNLIDKAIEEKREMDYLQVFLVTYKGEILKIVRKQEKPEHIESMDIEIKGIFNNHFDYRIYVIDNVDHSTMLFSHEY
jgi:hypothetical protein